MKLFKEALGIDVSKKTIDVVLHLDGTYHQFDNNAKGFKKMLLWAKLQTGLELGQVLICFEHTGLYSLPLATFLDKGQVCFCMVAVLEIKRSLGIARGKDDKVDASRIAEYAYLRREQLEPTRLPSKSVLELGKLTSLRERLVTQRAGYKASMKEFKTLLKQKDYGVLLAVHKKMIHYLNKQVNDIEKEMLQVINNDQKMEPLYRLITSVKGVGLILGANFLVTTNCFMGFRDGRKFACYAGIAPFKKQSGTSMKNKSRVSHFANKKMKALLNLAASSAIQADKELKAYYQRRIEKGKSRMSTLNIVRNKIVHRVFAVVNRGTPFVPIYQHIA